MKKIFRNAVWAVVMVLCTVLVVACNKYDLDEDEIIVNKEVKQTSCVTVKNTYKGIGVVKTRSSYTGVPDGELIDTSFHKATFVCGTQALTPRTYVGINKVKAYDVNRPRYATKVDIFKNASMKESMLSDGRVLNYVSFADGSRNFGFALVEEQFYDTDTLIVMGQTFNKCKNNFVYRRLAGDPQVEDLKADSADWHAYRVVLPFEYTLEGGENKVAKFTVTIAKLWVAKSGTNPNIPDDEPEVVMFEDKDKGFDYVDDTTSKSWFTLVKVLSDGTKKDGKTISVLLNNQLTAPDYQEKVVSNLNWSEKTPALASAVKNGALYEKEKNIFVQPYKQLYTTRTDKCEAIFSATYEGSAYYVDSLGKAHDFIDKKWEFANSDAKWSSEKLSATEMFNRILLTSQVVGTFNAHAHTAKGEVELKCAKDGNISVLKFEYKDFDIKEVVPNKQYYTSCTQYAVYSNDKTEKVGEIGVDIYVSTESPEKQIIDVEDFNIKDGKATLSNAVRVSSRSEKASSGSFRIEKYRKTYTTNTNKSDCKFVTHYEGVVVFTDSLGKEVSFKGIEAAFKDLGSSLEDLTEQDEKERKLLTSTITVACNNSEASSYTGQVEFRKDKEKAPEEELTDWSKTQNLVYVGNGVWKSTTVITYKYKLAGEKTNTISQDLIWSIAGEAKKQVILNEAKADYKSLSEGSETSSSAKNGNITVVTKKKALNEDYTTLKDAYTLTSQTASYSETVLGKTVSFDFLAPSSMTAAHKSGSLTNANTTREVSGVLYDVYNHAGSVSCTVDGKTESATVEKEVLVKKVIEPYNPAWGKVTGLGFASLVYEPNAGKDSKGAFHKTLVINFEKGKLIATTASYGPDAYDFTFDEKDFYEYGKEIQANYKINSSAFFNGRWIPALISMDGTGWKYVTMNGQVVNMSQNLALMCGIKNFTGQNTAENTPYLNYVGAVSSSDVLVVRNHLGLVVFTIK